MMRAAFRVDGQPVAHEAFYALACDPQRSVVVEACAGAGKTWMLVSRILRALLAGAQPQEILAITFTRKAAGEMRERLAEWLREFAAPTTPPAVRVQALIDRGVAPAQARVWASDLAALHARILHGGRPVQIRTFHAWFSQLLRVAPLQQLEALGLQPDMTLIEDLGEHRAAVWRRFHAAVLLDPQLQAHYDAMTARRGRSQLQKWLEAAWHKRVEFELADEAGVLEHSVPAPAADAAEHGPAHTPLHTPVHPAHALHSARWQQMLEAAASALGQAPGVRAGEAARALAQAQALAQSDPIAGFAQAWAALFTQQDTPRRQLPASPGVAALQDALAELDARVRQHEAHVEHVRMVRLARVLLGEYALYKRVHGLADMADLERCGLTLLRDATLAAWIQERLDARVRHVMIDEFQDTSPLQWHALHAWLSAYAGAGGGASGQHPPGVFIVGDPKQSIYRFRRAEPRVFEAARTFVLQALGGTLLACDHTRRNAPAVLAAVNAVFEQAQGEGRVQGWRAHTTDVQNLPGAGVFALERVARPARAAAPTPAPTAVWRDTLNTPRHTPDEALREQEAQRVARTVRDWIEVQGWRAGDIFVLSRKRHSLRLVAQALQRLHVPCAAVDDTELLLAAQARDLIALLDALVSPRHALSLVQALRSPMFGVSDAELVELAEPAGRLTWWRAVVDGDWSAHPALRRARDLLLRWQRAASQLPPHDLLDRIVHEGQVRERVAASLPSERRAAALDAIDAVLAQALTLNAARYATPYNFVRALRRQRVQVTAPAHAQAVQLLTVHGAKGLEAGAVFVMDAQPEPKSSETTTLLVDWPVQCARPLRCAFVYSEAACPPSLRALLGQELDARQREELNGLYVAMTRARQRLVFSATQPSRASPSATWWDRVEPVATAWPAPSPQDELVTTPPTSPTPPPTADTAATLWESAPLPPTGPPPPGDVAPPVGPEADGAGGGAASRLGQAVHRVLEWAAPTLDPQQPAWGGSAPGAPDLPALARSAAEEFATDAGQTATLARRILDSPACAPFFRGPALVWAGNEVSLGGGGAALRIDRLVCLHGAQGPQWWVLDYKLQHTPHMLEAYRAQLRRYRDAVRDAQPGARVRCAFLTGAGDVVELDRDDEDGVD